MRNQIKKKHHIKEMQLVSFYSLSQFSRESREEEEEKIKWNSRQYHKTVSIILLRNTLKFLSNNVHSHKRHKINYDSQEKEKEKVIWQGPLPTNIQDYMKIIRKSCWISSVKNLRLCTVSRHIFHVIRRRKFFTWIMPKVIGSKNYELCCVMKVNRHLSLLLTFILKFSFFSSSFAQ